MAFNNPKESSLFIKKRLELLRKDRSKGALSWLFTVFNTKIKVLE